QMRIGHIQSPPASNRCAISEKKSSIFLYLPQRGFEVFDADSPNRARTRHLARVRTRILQIERGTINRARSNRQERILMDRRGPGDTRPQWPQARAAREWKGRPQKSAC